MSKARPISTRKADFILCPLFVAHGDREILCESHIPDAKCTCIRFKNSSEKEVQQHTFCEACYERCEQYLAVKHFKWEEE